MLHAQRRTVRLVFVLAAILILAAGCGAQPQSSAAPTSAAEGTVEEAAEIAAAYPLAATAWDLDFFGPPDESVPVLPETRATLLFFWDRYAGFDGCNWLLGIYEADTGGSLLMRTPSQTTDICEGDDLYNQASLFTTALLNVTAYVRDGEQLIASTVEDQRLLTFQAAKPIPMPGTTWELKFWSPDGEAWSPVVPLSATTITFGPDAEAGGSGGCNDYTVTYTGDLQIEKVLEATDTYAELPALSFGPVSAQMAACSEPEGIMEQEQSYFVALNTVAYYFKLGGVLMLLDAEGAPLLVFAARS